MNTGIPIQSARLGNKLRSILRQSIMRPVVVLMTCLLLLIPLGAGLTKIQKDPSVDAFVPSDHPAAAARDQAREWFGLEDPIIVGLIGDHGQSVFTVEGLTALRMLHQKIEALPDVRSADVISVHSKHAISGNNGDLLVDPIIEDGPVTLQTADLALDRLRSMPMLLGLLANHDGTVATIIAPVNDPNRASVVYEQIVALSELAPAGMSLHVAGVAGMNARLADIVNTDTRIFIPAAMVTVLLIVWFALRKPIAVVGPLFVIAGSAVTALGLLGWSGADYYLITSALPVVIMALAVADSMHLSVYYLRYRSEDTRLSSSQAIELALRHTWLPISLTSVTTMAAFAGLSIGADMQPIREFGQFAVVGVAAAWILSLTALPAIIVLTNLKPAPQVGVASNRNIHAAGLLDRLLRSITQLSLQRPIATSLGVLALIGTLVMFAMDARFDYERKRYFQPNDPVNVADQAINQTLGGMNFLDVTVTAPDAGGIMTVDALLALAELRAAMDDLPQVVHVSGIDQSIAKMHEVLTDAAPGTLPERALAPAQYMFLYEASSEPEDFRHEIDYDHSRALIRAQLASDQYSVTRPVVRELEKIVTAWSAKSGLNAAVSGRVAVNEGWMSLLAERHFLALGLAALLVFLTSVMAFRALGPALLAMVPVGIGVLFVYATMGLLHVDIAPATSMTAAIATGLGVDFGIHLIAYVRKQLQAGASLEEALAGRYLLVARACFFSAVALGVALAVMALSGAPPLRWFGVLVSAGAFGSLIGAVVILPALLVLSRPLVIWRLRHAS